MAVWHPGYGLTYGQYLQAESFLSDVTGAVRDSGRGVETRISKQTKELVASNEQLAREFGRGFNSVNETLNWGFQAIESGFGELSASIDELSATFDYNMGLLIDQVSVTNELLSELLDKLDAIHKTLKSPTLTQAREYYKIGCERLSKSLLDKALEAFLAAESKNDTDFFTQFHIGKLYLYGIDEDDNVLDLEEAKRHLLLAARYAKAEINVDASFAKLAAESLLHASIAVYAQLGEENLLGDKSKSRALLEEAKRLVMDAINIHPQFSEASYHLAKYTALLGEQETSIKNLKTAIVADRDYAVKVDIDRAFDLVRSQVIDLLSRMKDSKKEECQNKLSTVNQVLREVSEWHLEESVSSLRDSFARCENDYALAQKLFDSDTYFGFLDAISLLDSLKSSLPSLKSQRESELYNEGKKLIGTVRATLPKSGDHSASVENYIEKAQMLVKKAESQLKQCNYESYKSAISIAKSADKVADSAKEIALREDHERLNKEKAALARRELQARRDEKSKKFAKYGAGIGAFFGCGPALGIAVAVAPDSSGGIFAALIGSLAFIVLICAGIGYLIGQKTT